MSKIFDTETTDIYIAVFHSTYEGYADNSCGKAYIPLSHALKLGKWPYDIGDDPSFFSQATFGSNLTWGVCRPQVRNKIRKGDIVVFVSVRRKTENDPFEYCLCGVATVERKESQTDLWENDELKQFQRYLNLLIRPKGDAFEHFEPGSEEPHKDWLWRMVENAGQVKEKFKAMEAEDILPRNPHLNVPIKVAKNYVIFSVDPEETVILQKPPLIALCRSNGETETWEGYASEWHEHIFGTAKRCGSKRRSLRTENTQHSHPVIRWRMPEQEAVKWRASLIEMVSEHVLR